MATKQMETNQHILRSIYGWMRELIKLADGILPVEMPQYMKEAMDIFPGNDRTECEKIYRLCYNAQNGKYSGDDWGPPYSTEKRMLQILMEKQFQEAQKSDSWCIVPEVGSSAFKELMTPDEKDEESSSKTDEEDEEKTEKSHQK